MKFHWESMVLITAAAFGAVRPLMPSHPLSANGSYEAFAHLFVGGLFGVAIGQRRWFYAVIAIALSLVELICFLANKP